MARQNGKRRRRDAKRRWKMRKQKEIPSLNHGMVTAHEKNELTKKGGERRSKSETASDEWQQATALTDHTGEAA